MQHSATHSSYVLFSREMIHSPAHIVVIVMQLHANRHIGNYWVRALPSSESLQGFDGGINSAILRYVGAPDEEPTTEQTPSLRPLNEVDLRPLVRQAAVCTLVCMPIDNILMGIPSRGYQKLATRTKLSI